MIGRLAMVLLITALGAALIFVLGSLLLISLRETRAENPHGFDQVAGFILLGTAAICTLFFINEVRIGWLKRRDREKVVLPTPSQSFSSYVMHDFYESQRLLLEKKAYEDALEAQIAPVKPKRKPKPVPTMIASKTIKVAAPKTPRPAPPPPPDRA